MQAPTSQASPSWDEIFKTIGYQFAQRGRLIARRTLAIIFPSLIIVGYINFILRANSFFSEELTRNLLLYGILGVVVALPFTIAFMSIFKIEQAVWLDSYFDGKNLTQDKSWKISKCLFVHWTYLQFKLFYRYYIWIWISIPIFLTAWVYLFFGTGTIFSEGVAITLSWILDTLYFIGVILWFRYLKL